MFWQHIDWCDYFSLSFVRYIVHDTHHEPAVGIPSPHSQEPIHLRAHFINYKEKNKTWFFDATVLAKCFVYQTISSTHLPSQTYFFQSATSTYTLFHTPAECLLYTFSGMSIATPDFDDLFLETHNGCSITVQKGANYISPTKPCPLPK